jgi:hypothetical protein
VYSDSEGESPLTFDGSIISSQVIQTIPTSGWNFFGGSQEGIISVTTGDCPDGIPLQVSFQSENSSCQGIRNCNGSISMFAQNGVPPYEYSINGGITYSTNNIFTNLCPNTYSVIARDSLNESQTSSITIGFDSLPVTYQLSLENVEPSTTTSIPNVSQTTTQVMNLVVSPPLPVGLSVTFNLLSTSFFTVNGPGSGINSVIWSVTKNNVPVNTIVGTETQLSQGTRPFCSPNVQTVTSRDYSTLITITNGDVINVASTTTNTITDGQAGSQTNCTTNINTQVTTTISTPTIVGNDCSSVTGGNREVQVNDFTYVPGQTPVNVNYQTAIIINDSDDSGKAYFSPSYDFTSNASPGDWYYQSGQLTVVQPSLFYTLTLSTTSNASPEDNDTFFMNQEVINSVNYIQFNPAIGNKMWYLISPVQYTSAQLTTILANATLIQNMQLITSTNLDKWQGTFVYDLNPTQSNYVYLIWDYRKTFN